MGGGQLQERVDTAKRDAQAVLANQPNAFRPPTEAGAPLAASLAAAATAARGVLANGAEARAQAGAARGEQRKAEDRQLIIDTAAAAGITLTTEQAEAIRSRAWRAADRAAQSDQTRRAARAAGEEGGYFGAQELRDSIGRVIGKAAEDAAYTLVRQDLAAMGLSGDALDTAARTVARQAGRREITDAGAWTRTTATEILTAQETGAGGGGAATPPTPPGGQATPPAQEQQQAPQETEEESGHHARALVFEYRVNADSFTGAVNNNLDKILAGGSDIQRLANLDSHLDRYGIRGGGHLSIRIDLDAVRAAGITVDEELLEQGLRTNPAGVLGTFLNRDLGGAIQITQTGGRPEACGHQEPDWKSLNS
ncbi:MAG: hypothetical protein AB1529_04475 [Candidatus Micrarchaeota archaeon]